jgi:hypothetical protein
MRTSRPHNGVRSLSWLRRTRQLITQLAPVARYRQRRELGEAVDTYVRTGRQAIDAHTIDLEATLDEPDTDLEPDDTWDTWKADRPFRLPNEAWPLAKFMLRATVTIVVFALLLVAARRASASDARDLLLAAAFLFLIIRPVILICLGHANDWSPTRQRQPGRKKPPHDPPTG